MPDQLALLWEKDRIASLVFDFGWALDSGDWQLYRSCLCDPVQVDFQRLTGFPEIKARADDWTEFARLALSPVKRHHAYTNLRIDVDGDVATGRVHMVARHHQATEHGAAENTQYGWYEFGFAKNGAGEWRIARLKHWFQWVSGNNGLFDFSSKPMSRVMTRIFNDQSLVN